MLDNYKLDFKRLKYTILTNGEKDYTIQPYIENIQFILDQIELLNKNMHIQPTIIPSPYINNDISHKLRDLHSQSEYYENVIEDIMDNMVHRITEYVFDNMRIKVRNGEIHSLESPAIISDVYDEQYFIGGTEYKYNDWVKSPSVRKAKINKLLGKSKTYF